MKKEAKASPRTLDQIRRQGLEALRRELGPVETVRFLQQFDSGQGDYSKERDQWLGGDVRTVADRIRQQRSE